MDTLHTTRRSASHGALHKSYTADAILHPHHHHHPHPHRQHTHSLRRPFRSLNENVSLLVSPGPLESMLRTTTETGDIGLFSIRPTRSTSSFHDPPSRRGPSFGDVGYSRRPHGDGTNGSSLRDDRRWLPSCRDTTLEVISMYGSDSLRSGSSAFSPPCDDTGQRSYSITTCSSRPPPRQKSAGALQSVTNDASLQRPRSPFPYPTRLKRPGVRPSSPALTENGAVDYSKMVGIDRVSRRTVHGSYKPTYPQYSSRPLPRPRRDGNRSSETSPGHNVVDGYRLHCGLSPVSPASWDNRYRGRLESSALEHSSGTSSLTSIVNMYQRSTCGLPPQYPSLHIQSPGTFYYDYSEGFEYTPENYPPVPDFPPPFSAHTANNARSRTSSSDESNSGSIPSQLSESDSCSPYSNVRGAGGSHGSLDYPSAEQSGSEKSSTASTKEETSSFSNNLEAQEAMLDSSSASLSSISPPKHDYDDWSWGATVVRRRQYANLTIRGRQRAPSSPISCNKIEPLPVSPTRPSPEISNARRSLPVSYGKGGQPRRNRFYSIDTSMSRIALFDQQSDAVAPTPRQQERFPSYIHRDETMSSEAGLFTDGDGMWQSPLVEDYHSAFRGHRRNRAVPTILAGSILGSTSLANNQMLGQSRTPLLAPKPISPARQLRLQNSVPQLMRALPPLPGGSVRSDSCLANLSSDDMELAMRFSPIDLSTLDLPQALPVKETNDEKNGEYPVEASTPSCIILEDESSFFKAGDDDQDLKIGTEHRDKLKPTRSKNGKLKLKVSRGALVGMRREGGAFRRNTVPSPGRAWAEAVPLELTRTSSDLPMSNLVNIKSEVEPNSDMDREKPCDEEDASIDSPMPTTPAPPLPTRFRDDCINVVLPVTNDGEMGLSSGAQSEARSSFSAGSHASGKSPRGLRKRLSDLRVCLAESRLRSSEKSVPDNGIGEVLEVVITVSAETPLVEVNEERETGDGLWKEPTGDTEVDMQGNKFQQTKGFRGRMSRWIKTARQAIRGACGGSGKRG
ncbi:hypothetical protein QBC35DRAFT_437869 [Podospora australis]|uniref:Uncharacterized protein n=1 Tax=Podospora australis TaxID=1536484 RepID=A0AAN6WTU1_9PEZI|nr:hypothetical protein QBC35DRAFT_437869 [Podospora australis]